MRDNKSLVIILQTLVIAVLIWVIWTDCKPLEVIIPPVPDLPAPEDLDKPDLPEPSPRKPFFPFFR